jgi:hypothetical protein
MTPFITDMIMVAFVTNATKVSMVTVAAAVTIDFLVTMATLVTVAMSMCQKCFTVQTFPILLKHTPVHTLSVHLTQSAQTLLLWYSQLNTQELVVQLTEYASLGGMCFALNC